METNSIRAHLALVLFFLLTGCATTNAPRNWLPPASEIPLEPYGAWVEVSTKAGHVEGELIAVTADSVFVADTGLRAIGCKEIHAARLAWYEHNNLWTAPAAGPIMTLFNGVWLIFTAPMWIVGGSIAATASWYEPIFDYPKYPLSEFARYARFPGGIPLNVDPGLIVRKPVLEKKSKTDH